RQARPESTPEKPGTPGYRSTRFRFQRCAESGSLPSTCLRSDKHPRPRPLVRSEIEAWLPQGFDKAGCDGPFEESSLRRSRATHRRQERLRISLCAPAKRADTTRRSSLPALTMKFHDCCNIFLTETCFQRILIVIQSSAGDVHRHTKRVGKCRNSAQIF